VAIEMKGVPSEDYRWQIIIQNQKPYVHTLSSLTDMHHHTDTREI